MQLYAGIDLHSNNLVVAIVDEKRRRLFKKRLANDLGLLLRVLEPYREELVAVAVESTYNWYWLVDGLQEAGYQVRLVNPAAIRQYEGLKHSSDEHEAFWIAHLMSLEILPTGYICPPGIRAVRDLLRKRLHLVRHRTSHLLSVQNLYARHRGVKVSGAAIKSMELDGVNQDFSDAQIVLSAQSSLSTIGHLGEWIVRLEGQVAKSLRLQPEFRLLQSVYGVGKILAMTIALETANIERFRKVGNYASYCRCVKSERFSNGKKKGVGNRKNGNRYLAWSYQEAAHHAVGNYQAPRRYYQRKAARMNPFVAWKALAHKLCRASYFVMRDQVRFSSARLFS